MSRSKGKKGGSRASAISDRSGFRYPMNEMVIEPGTGWLVHRSESDGAYSITNHPLNNLQRYLKNKFGDPFPVEYARPDRDWTEQFRKEGSAAGSASASGLAYGIVTKLGSAAGAGTASVSLTTGKISYASAIGAGTTGGSATASARIVGSGTTGGSVTSAKLSTGSAAGSGTTVATANRFKTFLGSASGTGDTVAFAGDAIAQLSGLVVDYNPLQTAYTFDSSNNVVSFVDAVGNSFISATGRYGTLDKSLYNGVGGLVDPDGTTHYRSSGFAGSATGFGGMVITIPSSAANDMEFLAFGTSSSGSQRASLRYEVASDRLVWRTNEADAFQTLVASGVKGNTWLLLWNFKSATEVDFYCNSKTPVTFNPYDAMSTGTRLWMFARSTTTVTIEDTAIGRVFHRNSAHNPISDPSINDILDSINGKLDLGLSL